MQLHCHDERPACFARRRGCQLPYVWRGEMQDLRMPLDFPHGAEECFHAAGRCATRRRSLQQDGAEDEGSTIGHVERDDSYEGGNEEIACGMLGAARRKGVSLSWARGESSVHTPGQAARPLEDRNQITEGLQCMDSRV